MTPPNDRDADGVCDVTEARLGSDPDSWDSDSDGMPDASELVAGFDPTDPISPGPDQVAFLKADVGAMLTIEVRSTVDGDGEGVTGQFNPRNSFDPAGRRASDYFDSGSALGAEPPDNVRDMRAEDEHFGRVIGKTRLRFNLSFRYDSSEVLSCAAALPFEYGIKSDLGGYITTRYYALIVTPSDGQPAATDYCQPVTCL